MENNAHSISLLRFDRREVCFPRPRGIQSVWKRPFNASVPQPIDRLSASQYLCRPVLGLSVASTLIDMVAKTLNGLTLCKNKMV